MSVTNRKVLVVFQHYVEGIKLSSELGRLGYAVDLVGSGFEALKKIMPSCLYDLVITELLLDGISGFALIDAVKKNSEIAVIAVNNGNKTLRQVAIESDIGEIFDLPIDIRRLCDSAKKIFRKIDVEAFTN